MSAASFAPVKAARGFPDARHGLRRRGEGFSSMRRLILFRHAKTAPRAPGQEDIDRPLTERGIKDSAQMARRLARGEDTDGEPFDPPLPANSAGMTAKEITKVIEWYGGEWRSGRDDWKNVWNVLMPISKMSLIPVTRRLNRLSDLNEPLGIHWSYGIEPQHGMEHYGANIAFGVVVNKEVDWVCTAARAINSWDLEGEISMLSGAKLELQKIEFASGT